MKFYGHFMFREKARRRFRPPTFFFSSFIYLHLVFSPWEMKQPAKKGFRLMRLSVYTKSMPSENGSNKICMNFFRDKRMFCLAAKGTRVTRARC